MADFTQKDFDNEFFKADYAEFKEEVGEFKGEIGEFKGEIGEKLDHIIKKLDAFDMIFIVNGGSDGKEVGFKRKDLFQILYDNGVKKTKVMEEFITKELDALKKTIDNHIDTGFKSGVSKLSWWGTKLIPIIILGGTIISLILLLIGQHKLAQEVQSIIKNN